jgi:crotonobetainyl-CoA:carnitine CoA-transferase CaiB-like acyl-CoA transferase
MGALDGLRIADFSWVGAGPRSTKDLADNGATVIKIESSKRLDLGRRSPPFANGDRSNPDASAFFAQTNTSKKSVTINLSDPQGVDVAKRLVAWADVVVENFGPGYMERIGLSFDTLRAINPGIILASVSVAGRTGPLSGFRGYGNSAAAYSGHADVTGWPGSEPHMPPYAYGDVVAPMFLTVAILAALENRDRTGRGCHLDVSQIESMVNVIPDLFNALPEAKPANADRSMCPHGVFPCRGEDQWIAIACEDDKQWDKLCDILGDTDLVENEAYSTLQKRQAEKEAIESHLARLTSDRDKFELEQILVSAGVAAAAVLDGRELSEHPDLNAAGHFVTVDHPVLGPSKMPAPPYTFSETPTLVGHSPLLGEHNSGIFVTMLGMDPCEVSRLQTEGVLA